MEKQKEKQKYIDFGFVKQNADFEQVVGYYNLKVAQRGKQLSVLCPFHDDTKPSLKVTPETRGFHCFGCGAKGNILDFVRYMEDCNLREAAEILANICRIDLAPPCPRSNGRPRPVRKVQRAETAADEAIEAEPPRPPTGFLTARGHMW